MNPPDPCTRETELLELLARVPAPEAEQTMPYFRTLFAVATLLLAVPAMAQKFDGLARTPQMGWNSWNKFGCNVTNS